MTKEEYNQLEELLGKLGQELGHKICTVPGHIHDGYYIGVYSTNSGHLRKEATAYSIEATVERLKDMS